MPMADKQMLSVGCVTKIFFLFFIFSNKQNQIVWILQLLAIQLYIQSISNK